MSGGADAVHPSVLTSADPLGRRQAVQGPLARDAIEGVLPSRPIRSSGSNHPGAHCVGEQHLAGLGECCDPSRNMCRDADDGSSKNLPYMVESPTIAQPLSLTVTEALGQERAQELRARGADMDWDEAVAYTLTPTTQALNELKSGTQP